MSSTCSETKIRLRCSDGEVIEVEKAVAIQSKTLKNMIEIVPGSVEIPLMEVDSNTVLRIISWSEKRIDKTISNEDLEKWDREFVNVNTDVLYFLMLAANYLEIEVLLEQVCDRVGDLIKGKTPEEIRQTFNIGNDFSKKEQKQLRRLYSWAF